MKFSELKIGAMFQFSSDIQWRNKTLAARYRKTKSTSDSNYVSIGKHKSSGRAEPDTDVVPHTTY